LTTSSRTCWVEEELGYWAQKKVCSRGRSRRWVRAWNAWRRGLCRALVRGACKWLGRPVGPACLRGHERQKGNEAIGSIVPGPGARRGSSSLLQSPGDSSRWLGSAGSGWVRARARGSFCLLNNLTYYHFCTHTVEYHFCSIVSRISRTSSSFCWFQSSVRVSWLADYSVLYYY
jgi:hypothetical protein